jgi:hypothetical protein
MTSKTDNFQALQSYKEILEDYIGKKDAPRVLGICQQILKDKRDLGLWQEINTSPKDHIDKLPTQGADRIFWEGYRKHIENIESIDFGMEVPKEKIQETQIQGWIMELGKNILNRLKETLLIIANEAKLLGRGPYFQKYPLLITTAFVSSVIALNPNWEISKATAASLTGDNKAAFGHLAQGIDNGYNTLTQFHQEAKKELSEVSKLFKETKTKHEKVSKPSHNLGQETPQL